MKISAVGLNDKSSLALTFEEKFFLPEKYHLLDRAVSVNFIGALNRAGARYLLRLEASAILAAVCDFCLRPFNHTIEFTVSEVFEKHVSQDGDVWLFSGDMIDISEALRVNLLLNFPLSFICSTGCKGLCLKCGQNLNEKDCGCRPEPDPRFELLRNLRR